METIESNTATSESSSQLYVEFSFELYTSNFTNAIRVETAAASAINSILQTVNLSLGVYRAKTQEAKAGIFKTTIRARTEGRDNFSDYNQTYAWSDMVIERIKPAFAARKLKAWLLVKNFPNRCSYNLRQTDDSDLAGGTMYL